MLARFGLGFKIPMKPLIIQILIACLLLFLIVEVKGLTYPEDVPFYDSLENITSWNINANFTVTLNSQFVQHGNYSLNFTSMVSKGVNDHHDFCNLTVPNHSKPNNTWFGFWFYCNKTMQEMSTISMYDTNDYYIGIGFWDYQYEMRGHAPTYGAWGGEDFDLNLNTWYWFELEETSDGDYYLYVNGTEKDSHIITDGLGTYTKMGVRAWDGRTFGKSIILDFVRIANQQEFPPSYPPPPPPPPPLNYVDEYFGLGLFIGGIIMMIYAPSWVAWKVKKSGVTPDTVERLGYAMLIFLVGFGLFLSFIYGSGA